MEFNITEGTYQKNKNTINGIYVDISDYDFVLKQIPKIRSAISAKTYHKNNLLCVSRLSKTKFHFSALAYGKKGSFTANSMLAYNQVIVNVKALINKETYKKYSIENRSKKINNFLNEETSKSQ